MTICTTWIVLSFSLRILTVSLKNNQGFYKNEDEILIKID